MNIAILGATGNIGKGLSYTLSKYGHSVSPYSRSLGNISELRSNNYPVIINCIGCGFDMDKAFETYETADKILFDYLEYHLETVVICMSSGAVTRIRSPKEYVSVAKLCQETKHRQSKYKIMDIRIFNYFSRFSRLEEPYFINQLVSCLVKGDVFVTDNNNLVRDYIDIYDLTQMVEKCIVYGKNDVFEAFSAEPTNKSEILNCFSDKFGLKFRYVDNGINPSIFGHKDIYIPTDTRAMEIGYTPNMKSIDTLVKTTELILEGE